MAKVYNIPLNRGYAGSTNDGEIPEGFWGGKNMMYREDGALRGRWSFRRRSEAIGSSNNWIFDLFRTNNTNYIAIASDGKAYYGTLDGSFTEPSWTGSPYSKPYITNLYRGQWTSINEKPIYTSSSISPLIFSSNGSTFSYLTGAPDDTYKCRLLIEHQNRILLASLVSCGSMIRYSDINDPDNGYSTNYVSVGDEKERVTGLHHMGGNLIVLKERAIWAKIGTYSELTSDQFQPVFQGVCSLQSGSTVGRDVLYFTDDAGIFAFSGGSLKKLDTFREEWMSRSALPGTGGGRLGYWGGKDWLWVANGSSYGEPLVYDVNLGVWYKFDGFNPQCFISGEGSMIFGQYGGPGKAYIYEYGYDLSYESAVEETIEQELITPFLDLGTPYPDKYLRKIMLYASGVEQVDVYLKTTPYHVSLDAETPHYTVESPADSEEINFDSSKPFRQICIKLTGSGDMVVKNIAVVFDERR